MWRPITATIVKSLHNRQVEQWHCIMLVFAAATTKMNKTKYSLESVGVYCCLRRYRALRAVDGRYLSSVSPWRCCLPAVAKLVGHLLFVICGSFFSVFVWQLHQTRSQSTPASLLLARRQQQQRRLSYSEEIMTQDPPLPGIKCGNGSNYDCCLGLQ